MTEDEIDAAVLHVLDGQHPDYLIAPVASAFVAAGLAPDDVEKSLARLAGSGHAEEQEVVVMEAVPLDPIEQPILDKDGNPTGEIETITRERGYKTDDFGEPILREKLDDGGNPITLAEGWSITSKGRKKNAPARQAAEQAVAESLKGEAQ